VFNTSTYDRENRQYRAKSPKLFCETRNSKRNLFFDVLGLGRHYLTEFRGFSEIFGYTIYLSNCNNPHERHRICVVPVDLISSAAGAAGSWRLFTFQRLDIYFFINRHTPDGHVFWLLPASRTWGIGRVDLPGGIHRHTLGTPI